MRPARITNHSALSAQSDLLEAREKNMLTFCYFFPTGSERGSCLTNHKALINWIPDTVCKCGIFFTLTWLSSTQILSSRIVLGELKLDSRHRLLLALRSSKRATFSACVQLFEQNYYIASWKALLPVLPRERSNFSRNKFHSCPY